MQVDSRKVDFRIIAFASTGLGGEVIAEASEPATRGERGEMRRWQVGGGEGEIYRAGK